MSEAARNIQGIYDDLIRIWERCRKIAAVAEGMCWWPEPAVLWLYRDTVAAATATTITLANTEMTTENQFYGMAGDYTPHYFDLIIDTPVWTRPWLTIRAAIEGGPAGKTLNIADITHQVMTEKRAIDFANLVGRPVAIVGAGKLWWTERLPVWPNRQVIWDGTAETAGDGFLTDSKQNWKAGELVDPAHDLILRDAMGNVRRVAVGGNTATGATWVRGPGHSWTPAAGTRYYIVRKDGFFRWERAGYMENSLPWYGGDMTQYHTVQLDRTRGTVTKVETGLDVTFHYSFNEVGKYQDVFTGPMLYRSLRGVQKFLEDAAAWCLDPTINYDGSRDRESLQGGHNLTTQRWFELFSPGGWPWTVKKQFRYFYAATLFEPWYDEGRLEMPPFAGTAGVWRDQVAGQYMAVNEQGMVGEGGAVAEGDIARYVGDDFSDPFPGLPSAYGQYTDAADYLIKQAVLADPAWAAAALTGGFPQTAAVWERGTITEGGRTWLRDEGKNWWTENPTREHAGTATAGTSTSLTVDDGGQPGWWAMGRHLDAAGNAIGMVGFVMRVRQDAESPWHKRVITGHAGYVLSWDEALPFSADGREWSLIEPPLQLNRWQGRTVRITRPGGEIITATITHSDDDTIWFADMGETLGEGWSYEIEEAQPGTTWLRSGGRWVKPVGMDARYGVPFPDQQTAIMEDLVTGFGRRICMRDVVTQELIAAITEGAALLRRVRMNVSWTAKGEVNAYLESAGNYVDAVWDSWAAINASSEVNEFAWPFTGQPFASMEAGRNSGSPMCLYWRGSIGGYPRIVMNETSPWPVPVTIRVMAFAGVPSTPIYEVRDPELGVYEQWIDGISYTRDEFIFDPAETGLVHHAWKQIGPVISTTSSGTVLGDKFESPAPDQFDPNHVIYGGEIEYASSIIKGWVILETVAIVEF